MKKIVKCILPIVSSAVLAAPVMVSCGQTYKALPDDAYSWGYNHLSIIGINPNFKDWDKYNTIQIRKNVDTVTPGVFEGDNFKNIKIFQIEQTNSPLSLNFSSVKTLPSLERIIFKNTSYNSVKNAFSGDYWNLQVLDYSAVNYENQNIDPYIFSSFPNPNHVKSNGTIYVKNHTDIEKVKELFKVQVYRTTFYGWQVKVK